MAYHAGSHNRINQSASVITSRKTITANAASGPTGRPNQRPVKPLTSDQGANGRHSRPNKAPPALAPKAPATWPRTSSDQDVVIPHDGQRQPVSCRNEQGGKPSR